MAKNVGSNESRILHFLYGNPRYNDSLSHSLLFIYAHTARIHFSFRTLPRLSFQAHIAKIRHDAQRSRDWSQNIAFTGRGKSARYARNARDYARVPFPLGLLRAFCAGFGSVSRFSECIWRRLKDGIVGNILSIGNDSLILIPVCWTAPSLLFHVFRRDYRIRDASSSDMVRASESAENARSVSVIRNDSLPRRVPTRDRIRSL